MTRINCRAGAPPARLSDRSGRPTAITRSSRSSHVRAGARVDLDRFAFLDEKRDVDGLAGLQLCRLGYVAGGIAAEAFRRFNHLHAYRRGQFNLHRFAFGTENLHRQVFHQIIFRLADQVFLQRDRVVRLRIHEMIAVAVLVTELERFSLDLDQFHLVRRTESDIGALAGVDVANDRLDERAQIPRRAMMHFEHNGGVAIVFYGHSSAKIVGGEHGNVESLKRSADVTRARQFCNCRAGASSAARRQPPRLPYNNFNRVKSCESTMPTGTLSSSMTTRSSMRWRSSKLRTSTASLSLWTVTGFNVIRSATRRSPIVESN